MTSGLSMREYLDFMRSRRARIVEGVERAADGAGRDPSSIEVCAVSKTVGVDEVRVAIEAGYASFAENRPQELERKLAALEEGGQRAGTRWHMIGNLQTNKINHVIACAPDLVHSISSLELARAFAKRARAAGVVQRALVEVNVSGEESKSGVSPELLLSSLDAWREVCDALDLRGLMTMAPAGDTAAAERTFRGLAELGARLRRCEGFSSAAELSMGMSGDWREAIAQGATIVRLGRIVFDPEYPFV